jgi:hypothetical protein
MATLQDAKQASPSRGKVVVLNGFPGVGKYTILKHIQQLLGGETTRLIDNHLIVDPIALLFPERDENHYSFRSKLRAVLWLEIRKAAAEGCTILMSDCLAETSDGIQTFSEYLDLVSGTDIPLYWITIQCNPEIHETRLTSLERRRSSKTKLTDVDSLRMLKVEYPRLPPPDPNTGFAGVTLITETLDVSGAVEQAVSDILGIIGHKNTEAMIQQEVELPKKI